MDINAPSGITKDNWKVLLEGKTIISKDPIPITADNHGIAYFFGEFTADGFKWGTSYSPNSKPAYNRGTVNLDADFVNANKANFTGKDDSGKVEQKGQIVFTVDNNTITDVTVKFTIGTTDYDGKEIKCGKPKELK